MFAEDLDLCGEIIDSRYRVERRIGQGGMGTVWQARHLGTRQLFAIKTVHGKQAPDHRVLRRLLHEARATAAIQSSHVVRVVDVMPEYIHHGHPLPFIVMEFLNGCNFSAYLDSAPPIATGELIWLTRQVSHALRLAHERGIVHRDLKPSNIFLAKDDDGSVTVKVCDFGIAKFLGAAVTQLAETGTLSTETGALFGTPRYMAPEQLSEAGHETPATDQWALGLIVFRALTGKTYFERARNLAELILAIAHDSLPPPSQVSSSFPAALDAWFLRCCARNPTERFESVWVQQQELEKVLGNVAEVAIEATQVLQAEADSNWVEHARTPAEPPSNRLRTFRSSSTWYYGLLGIAAICSIVMTRWLATRVRVSETSQTIEHGRQKLGAAPAMIGSVQVASTLPYPSSSVPIITPISAPQQPSFRPPASRRVPATRAPRPAPELPPSPTSRLLPRGAACTRSAQCEEGLCAAEVCQ